MFDGQCGEVRVRREVAAGAGRAQQGAENLEMPRSRVYDLRWWLREPGLDDRNGICYRQRLLDDVRPRGQSEKREKGHPSEPDGLGAAERTVEPLASGLMLR